MLKEKSINFFVLLCFAAILGGMGSVYFDNSVFRIISYIVECFIIVYTLLSSNPQAKNGRVSYSGFIIVAVILIVNYIFSPYEHNSTDLLKFFGYFCCYKYGDFLSNKYEKLTVNEFLVITIILIPVAVVFLFDRTITKDAFFVTSNTFVYIGVSMGLLYALTHCKDNKSIWKAWIFVAFYVLICTSLGVIVAIVISFAILNLRIKHFPYLVTGAILLLVAIVYVDLPVFVRVRDVIHLWSSMSADEWRNIQDVDFYDLTNRVDVSGERSDVTSSIWRFSQWVGLLSMLIKDFWLIPFGEGVGFCVDRTGLMPHNDFLLILVEYGAVVFSFVLYFIITKVYKRMKSEGWLIYFILPMILYHLTENLIQSFPPNVILYFTLGWCMGKCNDKKLAGSKKVELVNMKLYQDNIIS